MLRTMKKSIFILALGLMSLTAMAQYDLHPTDDGSKAVAKTDNRIKVWAKGVEVSRGTQSTNGTTLVTYGKPYDAVGVADSGNLRCVSLGNGGSAIVSFDRPIINGVGIDFAVFENAFNDTFLELAFVEVSSNGKDFFRFPSHSTATQTDLVASHYNNLAGKYDFNYGVGFDLDDLPDDSLLNKNDIRVVRIVDVVTGVSTDSQGNIIYDAISENTYSAGFDLSGVAILNAGAVDSIATMNGFLTDTNQYDMVYGSEDTTAIFTGTDDYGVEIYVKNYQFSGLTFQGLSMYNGGFNFSWGVSNICDTPSSAANGYTSSALSGVEGRGDSYLHAYYSDYVGTTEHCAVYKADSSLYYPKSVYVSQTLASASFVTYGGSDTNWMKIVATGYDGNNQVTGTAEVYLIDFRTDSNGKILGSDENWRYLDLSALGQVKKVIFSMQSSYANDYGLLIPTYFCMDNFDYINTLPADIEYDTIYATICDNEPYTLNGISYNTSGTFTLNDTILVLTVNPTYIDTVYDTIAEGVNYTIGDSVFTQSGTYQIDLQTVNGCDSTIILNLYVQTSSLENMEAEQIALYPNPMKDKATLSSPINSMIIIYNTSGKVVKSFVSSSTTSIIEDLPQGIYFINIQTKQNITTKKLIVQ